MASQVSSGGFGLRHATRGASLELSKRASRLQYLLGLVGRGLLLLITSSSVLAVLFIFFYVARDALPFFQERGFWEFLTQANWHPAGAAGHTATFGAAAIFIGSLLVTAGAIVVAVPLGVAAAVCLSDILPFWLRQIIKPIIEVLAAIPSVAYGFFALVIFAPLLQEWNGLLLAIGWWLVATPVAILTVFVLSDILPGLVVGARSGTAGGVAVSILMAVGGALCWVLLGPGWLAAEGWRQTVAQPLIWFGIGLVIVAAYRLVHAAWLSRLQDATTVSQVSLLLATGLLAANILWTVGVHLAGIQIHSGANALNVSIILGIMAMPTVVSVSEDSLQAVGRELREGAYALGATRAEMLMRVVIPAAGSGICAAVILGIMRAVGETMVVWMASGNAAQIPEPWYNLLEPIRTLTATIAGDMGEADHVTGSARYHVLFAMALSLLTICFVLNLVSERVIARSAAKHR